MGYQPIGMHKFVTQSPFYMLLYGLDLNVNAFHVVFGDASANVIYYMLPEFYGHRFVSLVLYLKLIVYSSYKEVQHT